MKAWKFVKALKIFVMVALVCVLAGFLVMQLWNWLMPALFGLRTISFLQALGLLVLSKILLGGLHRHAGGRPGWKRHMEDRWARMTPDERQKFREGMKGRWNCRPNRETNIPQPRTEEVPQ